MDRINIQTAQNIDIQYEIASVGDRLLAALLDMLLLIAYYVAMALILSFLEDTFLVDMPLFLHILIYSLLPILYPLLMETLWDGQTVGKRQMNIRVARLDGAPPAFSNYFMRWLLRFVDAGFFLIGVFVMLFTEKAQRLGDLAAGTIVIKLKSRVTLNDTIYVDLRKDYTPTFPQVERLSDADMEVLKDVLKAMSKPEVSHVILTTAAQAKTIFERKMGIVPVLDMSPRQFLTTVIEDYNYYKGVV